MYLYIILQPISNDQKIRIYAGMLFVLVNFAYANHEEAGSLNWAQTLAAPGVKIWAKAPPSSRPFPGTTSPVPWFLRPWHRPDAPHPVAWSCNNSWSFQSGHLLFAIRDEKHDK